MTEPTRVVAYPPIGSENNQPTWTRTDIEREVWRAYEEERNRPMHLSRAPCSVRPHARGPLDDRRRFL